MLTRHGIRITKKDIPTKILDELYHKLKVKPYIPSVFVKPQYVKSYDVFMETEKYIYLPKHFKHPIRPEIINVGKRDVAETDQTYWDFKGTLRFPIQADVVNSFLCPEPHDGIISLQTGGGKTVCALFIASQLRVPTIILVNSTFLKDQWVSRIKQFLPKARIGIVQGTTTEVAEKDVIVCMLQSLALKDYPPTTFDPIGFVIVDECHHIASEAFSQAIPKVVSKYMLGLSATPDRKDKLMYVINWFLGDIIYQSDTKDKIDKNVEVEIYDYESGNQQLDEIIYNSSDVMFTTLMINKLVEYEPRTKFIADIVGDIIATTPRQLLVLTDRVEHCESLQKSINRPDDSCILTSKVPVETREKWYKSKKILIATYQMCKEAFDVATLNTLVIATPRPDIDQIVGRILRTDKTTRIINPLIIDIVDPPFKRQAKERESLYKARKYKITRMLCD
jgi:superfamily II DNA or RNA helicase